MPVQFMRLMMRTTLGIAVGDKDADADGGGRGKSPGGNGAKDMYGEAGKPPTAEVVCVFQTHRIDRDGPIWPIDPE
jgi:hypothetical protein